MANVNQKSRKFQFIICGAVMAMGAWVQTQAAVTDLANLPLSTSSTAIVRPNILFTLDDSGSMGWNYLPDYAGGGMGINTTHCKSSHTCGGGEVPFQTQGYNGLAYNPATSYQLPMNADGTLKPAQNSVNTTGWTLVKQDGYGIQSTGTTNLVTGYPETLFCNGGTCKKNGVDTNNPFLLRSSVAADNPPVYAYPGSLTTGNTIASTPQNGLMNQPSSTSGTVYNGPLDITTSAVTTNLSGLTVTHTGTTVNVTYTALAPPLVSGDTVVVSGATSSCSTGFKSGGGSRTITVVDATHFTYPSNAGTLWTNSSCTVSATHAAHTAVAPMISKSGNTVTVTLTGAPTPALATGNLVTVANGAGTCDAGYRATSANMTRISATSFSYPVSTTVGTATNTTCNITQVATTTPVSPGIKLTGTTVTVYLTGHGLVTGDLVQVSNGTGVCDNGYLTSGSVTVTRVDNNTFTYTPPVGSVTTNSNCRIDKITPITTTAYTSASNVNGNPYYFVLIPTEYCDSIYLTNCKAASGPITVNGVTYDQPATLRFCKDDATAALPPGDAGAQTSVSGTINCQAKYSVGTGINFQSARYGLFWRKDIVPATSTYGDETFTGTITGTGWAGSLTYSGYSVVDRSKRSDCALVPNCTYAEEMTNFANWYAYYQTRMQMMKSAAGRAFSALDTRYRVGFITINPTSTEYLAVNVFNATQKTNWYAKFYAINPGNSTPLREALANAGRYFAGKKPWSFGTDDPMEYSCQANFVLITTDGYWNGTDSNVKELDGTTTMRNYDNVDSGFSTRASGAYDGGITGASNTLADAALYYYSKDIRNSTLGNCTGVLGGDVCNDDMKLTAQDKAAGLPFTQHMKTFSLGLADGLMTYDDKYDAPGTVTGDVSKIKTSATGCSFSGAGTCNWPLPVANTQTALDDLWHAAVNGRGTYYNARDPTTLASGLSSALANIDVKTYAAAASATSSPIITPAEHTIFSSTYQTGQWDGEVLAKQIDPATGNVPATVIDPVTNKPVPNVVWSASTQMNKNLNADATPNKAGRHIHTFDDANTAGDYFKEFLYANLTAAEKAYFDNKCAFTSLPQCTATLLFAPSIAAGNNGDNLVNYLRGSQLFEMPDSSTQPAAFRARVNLLGDTVNATPKYVKTPLYDFTDAVTPSYLTFKASQTTRLGVLYMGANDGMLHALNTNTGDEMWAYIPKIVMPNLYKIAGTDWPTQHQFYVDGSPETMDIFVDSTVYPTSGLTTGWHTILVGALGHGGSGFYALDITDPTNPRGLWEICSDSALCAISDTDMGYSYGNPVITKRSTDGKWVVLLTSGHNNVTGTNKGQGILYQLDAVTGVVLHKTLNGSGTAGQPSGLSKISPWVDSLLTNNTARFIYGGDLNGDIWRFDLGPTGPDVAPTVTRIASLKDPSGVAQPVTSRIELGDPLGNTPNSLLGTGNPGIFVGTGRYLGASDLSNVQVQTVYALKDDLSKSGAAAYIGNPRTPQAGFGSLVHQLIYEAPAAVGATVGTRSSGQTAVNWTTNGGWYADLVPYNQATGLPLSPSTSVGERVRLDPHLVSGTLSVISTVPVASACSPGGTSWKYSFDFLSGKNILNKDLAVLLNEGAEGSVVISVGGLIKELITLTGGDTVTQETPIKGSTPTRRTSWRELMQ